MNAHTGTAGQLLNSQVSGVKISLNISFDVTFSFFGKEFKIYFGELDSPAFHKITL